MDNATLSELLVGFEDWERKCRGFSEEVANGRFAGAEGSGMGLDDLLGEEGAEDLLSEIRNVNVAAIARMSHDSRDGFLSMLLRISAGSHDALDNSGFRYECDRFRVAAYDWSEEEDEDGNAIRAHDFWHKPSGVWVDWYKNARRFPWASPALVAAVEAARETDMPDDVAYDGVIRDCISSLASPANKTIEGCVGFADAWREPDPDRPSGHIEVDAPAGNVRIVHFRGTDFVRCDDTSGDGAASDGADDAAWALGLALRVASNDPLRDWATTRESDPGAECPTWLGSFGAGGSTFARSRRVRD